MAGGSGGHSGENWKGTQRCSHLNKTFAKSCFVLGWSSSSRAPRAWCTVACKAES